MYFLKKKKKRKQKKADSQANRSEGKNKIQKAHPQ